MNRIVHAITKSVDKVVLEDLSPKSMTSHGGNHKRTMNRSMRENWVGEFRRRVEQKCEALGIELVAVPAKYTRERFTRPTSQTYHVCGHVDDKSRSTRDTQYVTRNFTPISTRRLVTGFPVWGGRACRPGGGEPFPAQPEASGRE